MSSDPDVDPSVKQTDMALVLRHLPEWREVLTKSSVRLDESDLAKADTAGLQLIVGALLQSDCKLMLDAKAPAGIASLWSRLGLDDLADAGTMRDGDMVVGMSLVNNGTG